MTLSTFDRVTVLCDQFFDALEIIEAKYNNPLKGADYEAIWDYLESEVFIPQYQITHAYVQYYATLTPCWLEAGITKKQIGHITVTYKVTWHEITIVLSPTLPAAA